MSNFELNLIEDADIKPVIVEGKSIRRLAEMIVGEQCIPVFALDEKHQFATMVCRLRAEQVEGLGLPSEYLVITSNETHRAIRRREMSHVYAILAHEAGHVVNGDLLVDEVEADENGTPLIAEEEKEIAADNFAMRYVEPAELLKALHCELDALELSERVLGSRIENINSKMSA